MQKFIPAALAVLCILLQGCGSGKSPESHDFSNRISLIDDIQAASFEEADIDGFTAARGAARKDDGSFFGLRPHEGKGVLLVVPDEGLAGSSLRSVREEFQDGLDLSGTPVAQFSIFTQEGPAIEQEAVLRLFSGGGKKSAEVFEATAKIIPTLWRTVIFDISGCRFLSNVGGLEIGVRTATDEPWDDGREFFIDDVRFGKALDLGFMLPSSTDLFRCNEGGSIKWEDDALVYRFDSGKGEASLYSPDLEGSRNGMYNPPLEDRNTFFVVMENRSDVEKVVLSWETTAGSGEKEFSIQPDSPMQAYYFNISDAESARGRLKRFSISPFWGIGKGTWKIDQIRFEREAPIAEHYGEIISCTADKDTVRIDGTLYDFPPEGATVSVYEYPMKREGAPVSSLNLVAEVCPIDKPIDIEFPNSRLEGRMTHLSTRFLAVLRVGDEIVSTLGDPFYIENWRDFTENPYSFELPDREFSVLDYGAKGDGFTDDTKAIQRAIDECAKSGGRVVLPGGNWPYGRRYVATHLTLRSDVEFHLEEGAVLWQSYDLRDYDYVPAFGHDFDIPGCPWTHCLFINYPLLQGNDIENVKITGPGTIRMSDPWSVNPDWDHYARTCSDRIHICPVGISDSRNIEFTDIDIIRCNNYHTNFQTDENIFVGNVKLHEVQCVSGDGFSFGQGSKHIRVERCFFDSNDDGIVISNSYRDPRGKISPWRLDDDDADHSVRDLKVEHSYINSSTKGAGKAIAFIPWGTTNPNLTKQEIDGIEVYDCVLEGGHSVGTWCDNPHDGKPFDNNERDDYAPIKNVRILGNEYRSLCDMLWVKSTNFITDCGLHSASEFMNGDFSYGHCYWTMEGEAGAEDGYGFARNGGSIYEGLFLVGGDSVFSAEVSGKGSLFVKTTLEGETVASLDFDVPENTWEKVELRFSLPTPCVDCTYPVDFSLGLESQTEGRIRLCTLEMPY